MIITDSNKLSTTLFVITFPVTFLTVVIYLAFGDYGSKTYYTYAENYHDVFDKRVIKQFQFSEGYYILAERQNFLVKTSLMSEYNDDNINQGYTKITNILKYNEFSADSLKEALINSKIPSRDAQGMTQVRYNTTWYENSMGIISKPEIFVTIEIKLPLWINLESQCLKVKEEWNNFVDKLREHEEKHEEIFENYYKDIHKRVTGKTVEDVNDTVLPKWNKTDLLNEPAMIVDQMHEDYHHELAEIGLQPIPVDNSVNCDNG
jgi:predicted secreted Zn-dependent protease